MKKTIMFILFAQFDITDITHFLSTSDSEYPIYAWYSDYRIYWYTEADVIYLNEDCSHMFTGSGFINVSDISSYNISRVKNMSYMFKYCFSTSIFNSISSWDVSSVTDMSYMFIDVLQEFPIGGSLEGINNWDVRNVTNFEHMFQYYQGSRDDIVPGSSLNDIVFPIFSLRPGS